MSVPTSIAAVLGRPAYPWSPDQGDGTFRNPIIFADYSDPDVIRHGDDFYLVASSFASTPGLPVLHSRDLVNWTIVNHALTNLPDARYRDFQPGCGVWAPAIRAHGGKFWIFYPTPDEGIFQISADNPAGQWSPPQLVQAGRGLIDPCPLWDDDGRAYLVFAYAASRAGIKDRLVVAPMAPDGTRLLGEPQLVFSDPARHPTSEGPKFLKKDGWYYILAPAGGVATGWQLALRARSIYGPYEERIVLEQGSTAINGPHQGALVDLPNGDWWFLHFQEWQPYGRIVHLQPVEWRDGWPLIGIDHDGNGVGEPVLQHAKPKVAVSAGAAIPQTSDAFDTPRLGLQWQWQANHADSWHSLSARAGWLRLFAQPIAAGQLAQAPSLLLQKFPAPAFVAETTLELAPARPGELAGLIVAGRAHAALALRQGAEGAELVYLIDGAEQLVAAVDGHSARLRVAVAYGGLCSFSYALPGGEFIALEPAFQAREGHWIGAKLGLFSAAPQPAGPHGYADFSTFRFSPKPAG